MAAGTPSAPVGRSTFSRWSEAFGHWLFLFPAIAFFLIWQLWPVVQVAWIGFTDFRYTDLSAPVNRFGLPTEFTGFSNYSRVLRDDLMWEGLKRAFIFTSLFVPGMILFPMVLATLVDRVTSNKLATTYRLILLIPAMIPGPLVFVLWKWMYFQYTGPINHFLINWTGLYTIRDAPQWLGDPQLVFFSLAIMEWWWGLGYHTMFFLAGMATIPRDLTDAARVDGASELRLWWNIIVPRLLPVILVLVVLRFGSAMAVIDEYLIMGAFNRDRPTYTWTVYMWETAFMGDWRQGYAAAIGWVGALAMLVVVVGMFYIFRSRD